MECELRLVKEKAQRQERNVLDLTDTVNSKETEVQRERGEEGGRGNEGEAKRVRGRDGQTGSEIMMPLYTVFCSTNDEQ